MDNLPDKWMDCYSPIANLHCDSTIDETCIRLPVHIATAALEFAQHGFVLQ